MTEKDKISEEDQEELDKFKDFIEDLNSQEIDEQLENDIKSGKFDAIANNALKEHKNGTTYRV